jgi:hypothetical protein
MSAGSRNELHQIVGADRGEIEEVVLVAVIFVMAWHSPSKTGVDALPPGHPRL